MMRPADIIRAAVVDIEAKGVSVVWIPGWEDRGRPYEFEPRGCVCHHTATGAIGADYPSLRIVRDGRPNLRGPLAQFGVGRHTGSVYVIAAGHANHAGPGGWQGLSGNGSVWGIEAENDGAGERWSDVTPQNYVLLIAALARYTRFDAEMVCLHREWSPWKTDPAGIDGDSLRSQVADQLTPGPCL